MSDRYIKETGPLVDAVANQLEGLHRAPAGGLLACAFWRETFVAASLAVSEEAKVPRAPVDYGDLHLREQWLPVQEIRGFLREVEAGTARVYGLLLGQATGGGYIRHELHGTPSGWPEWQVRLRFEGWASRSDLSRDLPRDPVLRLGYPPYMNAYHAMNDWVFGNARSWDTTSIRGDDLIVAIPDTRARFSVAEWAPGRLHLEIEANVARNQLEAQVRFLGSRSNPVALLAASPTVEHDVPEDAESVVAFLVHADGDHLASAQLGRWSQPISETYDEPPTVHERALAEIAEGEGQYVEFKEFVRLKDPKEAEFERTLVAFANTGGGALYVGVRDDRTLQGSAGAREAGKEPDVEKGLAALARRIEVEIANWIKPERPMVLVHKVEISGAPLLAVHVARGEKIYSTSDETICVRRGATSAKASVAEIRELFDRQVRNESAAAIVSRPLTVR